MSTQPGEMHKTSEVTAHSTIIASTGDVADVFMGWALAKDSHRFHLVTFEPRPMGKADVDIAVHYSGICGSDIHVIEKNEDEQSSLRTQTVPGHEIVGFVVEAGPEAKFKVGDRVGAGILANACCSCNECNDENEQLCKQAVFTYSVPNRFEPCEKLTPVCGGFAARVRINSDFVHPIPEKIDFKEAATLMCSGISAYAALRHHGAGPDTAVGVLGIGSLGHLALQFAKAMGCKTILAMNEKSVNCEDCVKLGANKCYCNLRESMELLLDEMQDSLDLLLVNSFDKMTRWHDYLHLVKPRGKVVVLAMPSEVLALPAPTLVRREISVVGSFQGSRREVDEMLEFTALHQIHPWIVKRPINEINEAIESVKNHEVRYSMVLEMPEAHETHKGGNDKGAKKNKAATGGTSGTDETLSVF